MYIALHIPSLSHDIVAKWLFNVKGALNTLKGVETLQASNSVLPLPASPPSNSHSPEEASG